MKKLLLSLFGLKDYRRKYIESLETISSLSGQIDYLNIKLSEKQEQINKTNAYWKGVVRELKTTKKMSAPIKKTTKKKKDEEV